MTILGVRIPPIVLALLAALVGFLAAKRGFSLPGMAPAVA